MGRKPLRYLIFQFCYVVFIVSAFLRSSNGVSPPFFQNSRLHCFLNFCLQFYLATWLTQYTQVFKTVVSSFILISHLWDEAIASFKPHVPLKSHHGSVCFHPLCILHRPDCLRSPLGPKPLNHIFMDSFHWNSSPSDAKCRNWGSGGLCRVSPHGHTQPKINSVAKNNLRLVATYLCLVRAEIPGLHYYT